MGEPRPPASSGDDDRVRCPWCSATAPAGATRCPACGAALAQRDSIAGLVIPGVTDVDPNLRADGSVASPILRSQGTLATLSVVGHINPAAELAVAAAIVGQDLIRDVLGHEPADPANVGRASEAALQAAERLERDEAAPGSSPAPGPGAPGPAPHPGA